MAEVKWTDEQLAAIENRDKTLLVSAAAGSGKTATLTERIIRSLLDQTTPMNIDSLLVVTFTNAAASELRAKISKALTAAVEANPDNAHLKRQLYLLPSAKIRTIDSFCNEILRANCDRVGLTPGYRIADTAECELLAISIIEDLIEAVYNDELPEVATAEDFELLADCLTDSKRTEDLAEVFRFIHLRCESSELGIELLNELICEYKNSHKAVEDNAYGSYLMARYHEMIKHYIDAYSKYIRSFSSGGAVELKYLGTASADMDLLRRLEAASTYEDARREILGVTFVRAASVKAAEKTADMESFATLRNMMKADVNDMKSFFGYTTEMWQNLYENLYKALSVLYRFEVKFDYLFTEEKRRLGALSYADIERYTYKCLINNQEPTDIARNISRQFDAVYIDEYQDVNSLQNRIFEAISRANNRFMVGDIKQSIYGFRSARPEIFASMKNAFPPLANADGPVASIFMSRNFRCDEGVVDFVNNIFDKAFHYVAKSIGYVENDRLRYSKDYNGNEPEYSYPQICMVSKSLNEDDLKPEQVVALKIKELLEDGKLNNGDPIRPSDIAIILRNASGKDDKYATALEEQGIPSCISGAKDFFLSPEVLLALCLLNSIDNPCRDIYLAGLMCSPLFGFTADDLYSIRKCEGDTLYESLKRYVCENPDFEKGASFLKKLNHYRAISEGVAVDRLIYKLYSETGLMSLASKSGGSENLTLLYDFARGFEVGSFKGLYNFIQFINSIIDKKTTFDDARMKTGVDAVKIVTCHASKGLEYPVVFLVEADGKIYNKDRASRLAFSEEMGISMRLRSPSGLAVVNNPVQDIINHSIRRKLYEEELRVLYVALTRARERLFVIGKCPTVKRDEYEITLSVLRENLSEYSLRELSSYLEIALVCDNGGALDEIKFLPNYDFSATNNREENDLMTEKCHNVCEKIDIFDENSAPEIEIHDSLADELQRRFTYQYPDKYLTELPEKMSVSAMSPTVLDGTDAEAVSLEKPSVDEEKKRHLPAFADGGNNDESAKKGIATHLFLQFCDFDKLGKHGAKAEIHRLKSLGYLSDEDADRVRSYEIELFRKSELYKEMLSAKKLHRELRFNIRLPASAFTQEDERILAYEGREVLVQGVIDCIVERADGSLALYDYKTDRLSPDELADRTLAEKKLRDSHKMQLDIYTLAVEKIFEKTPKITAVYSLPLGDTVSMK